MTWIFSAAGDFVPMIDGASLWLGFLAGFALAFPLSAHVAITLLRMED